MKTDPLPPTSASEVYGGLGQVITEVVDSPGFSWRLEQFGRTIRFSLSDPVATITVERRGSGEFGVVLGASVVSANLVARMSTTTAHQLFLGQLNIFLAMDFGDIAFSGDPTPFVALIPQLRTFVAPSYRHQLQELKPALEVVVPREFSGDRPLVTEEDAGTQ